MFEELVTEFGLTVEDGVLKYATYEDIYVMSTMYNTIYIRNNHLMKKFVGTKDEARLLIDVLDEDGYYYATNSESNCRDWLNEILPYLKQQELERKIRKMENDFK